MLPTTYPPSTAVHQQTQHWIANGCFEAMVQTSRRPVHRAAHEPAPSATVLGSRTLRSTHECGHGAGYDGHKRTEGAKVHASGDTLGRLLAVRITPADAKRGFVLMPKRWGVERGLAWATRFRRLAKYHEHLPVTVAGHFVASTC